MARNDVILVIGKYQAASVNSALRKYYASILKVDEDKLLAVLSERALVLAYNQLVLDSKMLVGKRRISAERSVFYKSTLELYRVTIELYCRHHFSGELEVILDGLEVKYGPINFVTAAVYNASSVEKLVDEGHSVREISAILEVPHSTVHDIFKRFCLLTKYNQVQSEQKLK